MNNDDGPMPLSQLPDYMRSVRERGQGDYVPVVDMGMIVEDTKSFNWFMGGKYAAVACLFVIMGVVGYAFAETKRVVIDAGGVGPAVVADIVSGEGGRVFSATEMEDGKCEVRFFTFKKTSYFIEQLKKKKEFIKVEIK